ncbi:DUF58 domain-containing protein [uncultured Vibrio sp.]|uniref:DUF58 domain-containing protein n=1 Tax=uncultured Vibrio sp. TaxID=114054 RepID=UPI0025EB0B3A|nr:DUF58 domain-containing protein [uncultured Vibrio sp.]
MQQDYYIKGITDDPRIHVNLEHLQRMQRFARHISFLPKQPAGSVLNGQHASKLRGRGLNFEELRHYQKGDDVRTIDWKVTARTKEPYVRVYTEERDRPTLLLVDQRMSMFFGSEMNMKSVTAAESAALAAWRIRMQGDRVGGIVFSDDKVAEFTPKSSNVALNRYLSALSNANCRLTPEFQPETKVSLNSVLQTAVRVAKTGMMILIFSDFHDIDEQSESLLRRLSAHNDVLMFHITDPLSTGLPENFNVVVSDGDLQATLDASKSNTKEQFRNLAVSRDERLALLERKYGLMVLPLTSAQNTEQQVLKLLSPEAR